LALQGILMQSSGIQADGNHNHETPN
jgi:hypothetical protein